jgi:hypothetical protein
VFAQTSVDEDGYPVRDPALLQQPGPPTFLSPGSEPDGSQGNPPRCLPWQARLDVSIPMYLSRARSDPWASRGNSRAGPFSSISALAPVTSDVEDDGWHKALERIPCRHASV